MFNQANLGGCLIGYGLTKLWFDLSLRSFCLDVVLGYWPHGWSSFCRYQQEMRDANWISFDELSSNHSEAICVFEFSAMVDMNILALMMSFAAAVDWNYCLGDCNKKRAMTSGKITALL
jgi:hypothetical protein